MFSPILATVSEISSAIVLLPVLAALIFSTSAPTSSATLAIIFTRPWNRSLRATKSVSELTSTTTPLVPLTATPIKPSAATRLGLLRGLGQALLAQPVDRGVDVAGSFAERAPCNPSCPRRSLAQVLDHLCCDLSHCSIRCGVQLPARAESRAAAYSAVSSLALATQPWTRPGNPTSSPTLCAASGLSSAICV